MDNKPRIDWNQFFLTSLDLLVTVGDWLMLGSQTVIVSFGVPTVLVLAVIVEQQRVQHGIALFEQEPALAALGSWVLVVINLVFEFQAHHIENRAGYKMPDATQFSLRLLAANALYILGIGSAWQARQQSPAKRYYEVGRIVTISILTLALAGSMKAQLISQNNKPWLEGVVSIITDSTLMEMSVWAGGLLFAFAAVTSAQASSRYIATRVVEIRNAMTRRKATERTNERQTADDDGSRSVHSFAVHSEANERTRTANRGERTTNAANGYQKNMSAREVAAAFIRSQRTVNPEIMTMPTNELHALLLNMTGQKIGRTTAHEARKDIANERQTADDDTKETFAATIGDSE
jgi:hypothetical protein